MKPLRPSLRRQFSVCRQFENKTTATINKSKNSTSSLVGATGGFADVVDGLSCGAAVAMGGGSDVAMAAEESDVAALGLLAS